LFFLSQVDFLWDRFVGCVAAGDLAHDFRKTFLQEAKGRSSMKTILPIVLLVVFPALLASSPSLAQAPAGWHDNLADQITGTWKVEGKVLRRDAHHEVNAEWVLNHQFVRIHEKTTADAPASENRYEAIWFLGYDAISERYVLHLIDIFGGRFSETPGYGTRNGNEIRFVFEYPDGPFHTAFRWSPENNSWQWLLEQKDKDGKWTTFADLRLTPALK
jgi:hypothetical protein